MNLVAIETASGLPSVCLWRGTGANPLWQGPPRSGPEPILDAVRNLLDTAGLGFDDLDAVACGRGPGAFTGVRLAISLAQGLALGAARPVVGVSELEALAWRAHREHGWERVLACLDARRGEVYWGAFACEGDTPRRVGKESLTAPEALSLPAGRWRLAGSGAELLPRQTAEADPGLVPDAEAIGALAAGKLGTGGALSAALVEPAYLRDRVAEPRSRKR